MHPLQRKHSDSSLLNLYCVRHAQAGTEHVWRHDPDTIKKCGLPLSEKGNRQAQSLAEFLSGLHFDHMFSSDLLRALETARIIAALNKSTSLNITADLREVHAWHIEDAKQPSEECIEQERRRITEFVTLLRSYSRGENVLIVTHGNYLRYLLALMAGCEPRQAVPFELYNASLTSVIVDESGRLRIQETNNTQFIVTEDVTMI